MTCVLPDDQPTLRVIPQFRDTNPRGDIFGGWLMSQIDVAGSIVAYQRAQGPVATVAVKKLLFKSPLFVGDIVSFYAKVVAIGKTSISVDINVYAEQARQAEGTIVHVSQATLVYVAISAPGEPRSVPQDV